MRLASLSRAGCTPWHSFHHTRLDGDVSGMRKIRQVPVPNRTAQPSFFVMITGGGHHDNVSIHRMRRNI